jgi:hypothetical protein
MNQAVFKHFREMHYSSAHACAEITGVTPAEVTATMREMQSMGQLQEVAGCEGLYMYCNGNPAAFFRKKPAPELPVPEPQRKMWWAMCMPMNCPGKFSAFAIAQLAGVTEEYAQRYITGLRYRKFVKVVSQSLGWNQYRITTNAPPAQQPPRVNIQIGG